MLRVWGAPEARPTRDIDLLGYVDNSPDNLANIVREICEIEVGDDGLVFDPSTIAADVIKKDAVYEGVRVSFTGYLERARIPMQVDVGFGDVVHPQAKDADYPTILDHPAPRLRAYPREAVVAEKFQALVFLGSANTRMKDFFDLWLLSRQFDFEGGELASAIEKTFANRGTAIDSDPVALTPAFTALEATQRQWRAFVRRANLDQAPEALDRIREPLRRFLLPIANSIATQPAALGSWRAPGPWVTD